MKYYEEILFFIQFVKTICIVWKVLKIWKNRCNLSLLSLQLKIPVSGRTRRWCSEEKFGNREFSCFRSWCNIGWIMNSIHAVKYERTAGEGIRCGIMGIRAWVKLVGVECRPYAMRDRRCRNMLRIKIPTSVGLKRRQFSPEVVGQTCRASRQGNIALWEDHSTYLTVNECNVYRNIHTFVDCGRWSLLLKQISLTSWNIDCNRFTKILIGFC